MMRREDAVAKQARLVDSLNETLREIIGLNRQFNLTFKFDPDRDVFEAENADAGWHPSSMSC
jgi:hypothetical protein